MTDINDTLKGIIDLHIHAGPSVARRKVDVAEMVKSAIEFGYRGFVVKDHYFPTAASAQICEQHLGSNNLKIFGGIALNNSVGGINVKAIDAAYGMGCKFVYMPTVSSRTHINAHKDQHFPGAAKTEAVPEVGIVYIDSNGELKAEVMQVLEYIAKRQDLILATGHGSVEEIDALISKASELGISKIYCNHPFYMVNADIDTICRWSRLGAIIEINACVFLFGENPVPMNIAKRIFERVELDKIVLSSDLGQTANSHPAQGLYDFIIKLQKECDITEKQINAATRINPAVLLDI